MLTNLSKAILANKDNDQKPMRSPSFQRRRSGGLSPTTPHIRGALIVSVIHMSLLMRKKSNNDNLFLPRGRGRQADKPDFGGSFSTVSKANKCSFQVSKDLHSLAPFESNLKFQNHEKRLWQASSLQTRNICGWRG